MVIEPRDIEGVPDVFLIDWAARMATAVRDAEPSPQRDFLASVGAALVDAVAGRGKPC